MGRHTWRLVADDEDYEVAEALSEIITDTETEPIDHWFQSGRSIFMGRGAIPEHRFIDRRDCAMCPPDYSYCTWCCGNGFVLEWTAPAGFQVLEAIHGLRALIKELEEPIYVKPPT